MAWKYLNPGDYRLLHKYNASSCVNYVDKTSAPVTGISFSATDSNSSYPIIIPTGIKDIWVAFSLFSTSTDYNNNYLPRIALYGVSEKSTSNLILYVGAKYVWILINNSFVLQQYQFSKYAPLTRVWLHVKSGVSDGIAEVFINNVKIYSIFNRNVMNGEDIICYSFHTKYIAYSLSDIIFSDEPIDKDEHVAVLPISSTNADGWTYDAVNNLYTADSAGKSIWQVPDINQLKAVTGLDNPSITAVAVQAYNVSTNDTTQVDTLQKAVKQNGQTVIIDSADISSATNVISPAMTINPVTNAAWTLSDLANLQLGITTAKSA